MAGRRWQTVNDAWQAEQTWYKDAPHDETPLATLVRLTENGDVEGVDALLVARGHLERVGVALCIDCLDPKSGMAAIHIAAGFGFVGVVQCLLKHGASAMQITSTGVTALHCAVTHCRSIAVLETLLAAGIPIDARGLQHGLTALMTAAQRGLPRCVEYLIEAGARTELTLTLRNERRGSDLVDARGLAATNGHSDVEAVFAALVGAAPPKAAAGAFAPMPRIRWPGGAWEEGRPEASSMTTAALPVAGDFEEATWHLTTRSCATWLLLVVAIGLSLWIGAAAVPRGLQQPTRKGRRRNAQHADSWPAATVRAAATAAAQARALMRWLSSQVAWSAAAELAASVFATTGVPLAAAAPAQPQHHDAVRGGEGARDGRASECVVCMDGEQTHALVPCGALAANIHRTPHTAHCVCRAAASLVAGTSLASLTAWSLGVLCAAGHQCVCAECSESLMNELRPRCPACRTPIESSMRVWKCG